MDDEIKRRFDEVGSLLKALQDATDLQTKLNARLEQLRRQIKTDLLGAAVQSRALWVRLSPVSGRDTASKNPDDYDIIFESKLDSAPDEQWKLEVNDRYQKSVGTVISLSTATLGAPFVFLKNIHGDQPIGNVLTHSAYRAWYLLAASIVSAVVYYFFSAKWVKLTLANKADLFGLSIGKWFVELVLDVSYFLMMVGFLAGVYCMVQFMVTYVPK
jgi:hypothetical protein